MKLFIWEPDAHGPMTVSVAEENLELAQKAAGAFMAEEEKKGNMRYYFGWGTDKYQLEIHERGVVVTHAND